MVFALTRKAPWTAWSQRGKSVTCAIKLDIREAGSIANDSSALLKSDLWVWRRRRSGMSLCPSVFTCWRLTWMLTSAWREDRCQVRRRLYIHRTGDSKHFGIRRNRRRDFATAEDPRRRLYGNEHELGYSITELVVQAAVERFAQRIEVVLNVCSCHGY